jgi:hypothetical protein
MKCAVLLLALASLGSASAMAVLPASCPAPSATAINCYQGMTASNVPAGGMCYCQPTITGSAGEFAVTASSGCTTASCAVKFPTYTYFMYKSNAELLNGDGTDANPGMLNTFASESAPGGICLASSYFINAEALAATGVYTSLAGATINMFSTSDAAGCATALASTTSASYITKFILCSTSNCNTASALAASPSTSGASLATATSALALVAAALAALII